MGQGSYFSTTTEYSAYDDFSPADDNGVKSMILTRVVTGEYCKGSPFLVCAPDKPDSDLEQYDSVVDDEATPMKFVVFEDFSAYPEYVIKFTMDS